jgi:hypothetical protein
MAHTFPRVESNICDTIITKIVLYIYYIGCLSLFLQYHFYYFQSIVLCSGSRERSLQTYILY